MANPFDQLFNMILDKTRYPSSISLENNTPVYKKKCQKNDPSNYRLISLISPAAKAKECVLTEQLKPHLNKAQQKIYFDIGRKRKWQMQ